ncbi:hypothetical protein [Streptomyces subrutilus]|uniref:ATP-binding protein n=1 Tax=Streptomyces subrutilus TaxID=36818 RepID=A0A1E5PS71_9ACTN|nr:hypothetical protein [Streptomyces subrutilus]OEJ32404.1 hypothetical protein BGK67_14650 [Streptomyces subrutilus]
MNAMKRTLSALVLSGGAALALTPVAAHADEPAEAPPVAGRVLEIVDHPGQTVQDTKTALGVTAAAAGSATKATDSSLSGAGNALSGGLPSAPKVR